MKTAARLLLLCLVAAGPSWAQTAPASRPAQLIVSTAPSLVDCAPVVPTPCLSMTLTPSDSKGDPAPFAVPAARDLPGHVTLETAAGDAMHPFYAATGDAADAAARGNVALLVIDISGSMNQPSPGAASRFAAIKGAVAKYVANMQESTDRIAIVPFESHNVVSTIRGAVFATRKADVLAQLNALPAPAPKNNTALFQAVFTGVDTLKGELQALERDGHTAAELQPHLIVMTDGKNEVLPGDDPYLLNGPLGLQQAAEQVSSSGLDVVGVGFGDRAAIDVDALKKLSTKFFYAADADQLLAIFHSTRSTRSHGITITWLSTEADRLALTGRDQRVTPTLALDGSPLLTGPAVSLIMPATAAPHFDRVATRPEMEALIALHPPTNSGWSLVLLYGLLLLASAALLLVLWFWVPRLVWGERYAGETPAPARWGAERPTVTAASGVQIRSTTVPAGFDEEARGLDSLERSPAQTTQVGPRAEGSRTRLV